jgi:glycolate oxidase iron-sulfur subunit
MDSPASAATSSSRPDDLATSGLRPDARSNGKPGGRIDYELFLDCVHCGLCTSACPTYVELGTEMDSPRGRIYLMRGVTDGRLPLDDTVRRHLDLCLDCRACETACPSGVQYGKLIEPFRVDMQRLGPTAASTLPWWQRFVLFSVFPYAARARLALWPVRLMQRLGLDRWLERLLPERMRQMQAILPRLKPRGPEIPELLPAKGKRRARVALFTGCIADAIFHDVNWATARVLQENGCEVWTPRTQVCCGALHHHSGLEDEAIRFARTNSKVFADPSIDAIIINVAGCGSTLKDYAHILENTSAAKLGDTFTKKAKDVSEFLMELGPVPPRHPLNLRATYHDACHLCHAQQIRKQPRQLLEMIPGLKLVPLNETELCCGAAGSYNLTQPEMAERLGERKANNILDTQPEAVFTANAGCLLQIAKHLRDRDLKIWVAHPVEALWRSYGGQRDTG